MTSKNNGENSDQESNLKAEYSIYSYLKKNNLIIPTTIAEVEKAEALIEADPIELPQRLANTDVLFQKLKTKNSQAVVHTLNSHNLDIKKYEESFALAAREKKVITPEVFDKMKRDRDENDKNSNT